MRTWRGVSVLAVALTATPGAALPLVCQDGEQALPQERAAVAGQKLGGTYRCRAEGLTITLILTPDGRFEERFESDEGALSGAERTEFEQSSATGRWRVEHDNLYLFKRPERAPVLTLIDSTRDPTVRMRVVVRNADGTPARGLFVGEGLGANPQSQLGEDGILTVPTEQLWSSGVRQIVRQGDDLPLASFTATEGGPNVFHFSYQPSDVEPFEIRAHLMGASGDVIVIPFGITGAILRRTKAEP